MSGIGNAATRYVQDFAAWTADQAALMRAGRFDDLDVEHIAEEIGDLGSNVRRAFASRLAVLLQHLLKWQCQPQFRSRSWQLTIVAQRIQITRLLVRSPSLRAIRDETMIEAYDAALRLAAVETGLQSASFREKCEWTFEQVLDDAFWPESH